jgi:hypothetical protein
MYLFYLRSVIAPINIEISKNNRHWMLCFISIKENLVMFCSRRVYNNCFSTRFILIELKFLLMSTWL